MAATLHALAMIALAVLTGLLCWKFWKEPVSTRRVAWSLVALLAPLGFPPHLCGRGQATMQGLLGGACMAAAILCVPGGRARWMITVCLGVSTVALMLRHDDLVHRHDLIGVAGEIRVGERFRESRLGAVKRELQELPATSGERVPQGWISDQRALMDQLTPDTRPHVRHAREVGEPLWHSWFTRLYSVRKIPVELWSPGGDLKVAAEGLEWRER